MRHNRKKHILHLLVILLVFIIYIGHGTISSAEEPFYYDITVEINLTDTLKPNSDAPLRLVVPTANIDLQMEAADLVGGTWTVSETGVSYAPETSEIQHNLNNLIAFAHARPGLFQSLINVNINDEILVLGKNADYTYIITHIEKILPEDVEKIKSSGEHQLTLFTCEGYNDERRLLIKAKRKNTPNIKVSLIA